MKYIRLYIITILLFSLATGCDEGFDELNTNKTAATTVDPVFLLNQAIINSSFGGNTLVYEMGVVQQIITPFTGVLTGANFNQDNRDVTDDLWQSYYRNVVRNTRDVILTASLQEGRSNLVNMGRILQAYAFLVLTDTYGDIPYFEGGQGYYGQIFFPAYDAQEVIYDDIISELTAATQLLDPNGRIESGDVLYGGNIDKWKKFGYSILLRAGMRLSKINPTKAESTVSTAFQGGVITSNLDNAVVRHDNNFFNNIGNTLNGTEASNYYLADPFVTYLRDTDDPRLSAIAVRYVGAASGPGQVAGVASTDPDDQVGMPFGYNNSTISSVVTDLGLASLYDFSQADRTRIASRTAPQFLVTAAQSLLLLAEARERDWISTGTAEEYYEQGVTAHMVQMASYGSGSVIDASAIADYLTNNPFDDATALEQINTQYWIASFMNGPEAFANFRRSGYPVLTPNPFPASGITGDFIRRLTYPNSEISVNTGNVNEAIARMGPDLLDTPVWWDND